MEPPAAVEEAGVRDALGRAVPVEFQVWLFLPLHSL